jgi:hypothetical protein
MNKSHTQSFQSSVECVDELCQFVNVDRVDDIAERTMNILAS